MRRTLLLVGVNARRPVQSRRGRESARTERLRNVALRRGRPGLPGRHAAVVGGFVREGPANFVGADFLYGVIDNGPAGSGADQAGFIDVNPELDPYPGLPPDFPKTCPTAEGEQANFGSLPLIGDIEIETP